MWRALSLLAGATALYRVEIHIAGRQPNKKDWEAQAVDEYATRLRGTVDVTTTWYGDAAVAGDAEGDGARGGERGGERPRPPVDEGALRVDRVGGPDAARGRDGADAAPLGRRRPRRAADPRRRRVDVLGLFAALAQHGEARALLVEAEGVGRRHALPVRREVEGEAHGQREGDSQRVGPLDGLAALPADHRRVALPLLVERPVGHRAGAPGGGRGGQPKMAGADVYNQYRYWIGQN